MSAMIRRDWTAAAYTLIGPGLGHLHQDRDRAGAFFILWTLALAAGIVVAPSIDVSSVWFLAEFLAAGGLALYNMLRRRDV